MSTEELVLMLQVLALLAHAVAIILQWITGGGVL